MPSKSLSKTKFKTGAVRDNQEGKEDYIESISWIALQRYAKYMSKMASKYGRGNWRKGIPIESYEQSLLRHIQKYIANKYDDAGLEPEIDHLGAALFNLTGIMHEEWRASRKVTKTANKQNDRTNLH